MHLYSCALAFFIKWTVSPPVCSCHMHMLFFLDEKNCYWCMPRQRSNYISIGESSAYYDEAVSKGEIKDAHS
jgi:hypothetical protein